jgi:hypothetical protein
MALYDLLASLPLRIESYTLEGLARTVSSGFERKSTVIVLHGAGEQGRGEDVTYEAPAHDAQQQAGPVLELAGEFTFDAFSEHLGALDLFPGYTPEHEVYRRYRRWGFESAALDLALRQAGTSLHELQATGAVDSIDFKGAYRGTVVDVKTDPDFYRRIAQAFPDAWLEDPDLETDEARNALAAHQDRITWDAPIHDVKDILAAPVMPRTVNLKPSRFGSVKSLFEGYEFCEQRGMGAYGGGQYELGVGRGHVQLLAALFHPNAPNDIAPGGFDALDPEPGLPESPLDVDPAPRGFRRNID